MRATVAANFDKTINFKNTSPKVSLDYQITPDIMVYGLASRGFKSGGFNIRAQATAVPRSAEPFDDEQVDSSRSAARWRFLDQTPVPEPGVLPQQVRGHPAVGLHRLRQQRRRRRRCVLRRLHQRRRRHGQGRRGRVPVAADAATGCRGNLAWLDAAVRRVHLPGRQHRRRAGVHQCAGILRRAERGIPHRSVAAAATCRRASATATRAKCRRRPRSVRTGAQPITRTATAWSTPA